MLLGEQKNGFLSDSCLSREGSAARGREEGLNLKRPLTGNSLRALCHRRMTGLQEALEARQGVRRVPDDGGDAQGEPCVASRLSLGPTCT